MDTEKTKVAFFIERKSRRGMNGQKLPREVTAVFVGTGNYQFKECYCHEGQHGTCGVDWIADSSRAANLAEYKPLMDELQNMVGYNLEVIDAEWWIAKTMENLNAVQGYYEGKRDKVA